MLDRWEVLEKIVPMLIILVVWITVAHAGDLRVYDYFMQIDGQKRHVATLIGNELILEVGLVISRPGLGDIKLPKNSIIALED